MRSSLVLSVLSVRRSSFFLPVAAVSKLFHVRAALNLAIFDVFIANHLACTRILILLDYLCGLLAGVVALRLLRYCFLLTVLDNCLLRD